MPTDVWMQVWVPLIPIVGVSVIILNLIFTMNLLYVEDVALTNASIRGKSEQGVRSDERLQTFCTTFKGITFKPQHNPRSWSETFPLWFYRVLEEIRDMNLMTRDRNHGNLNQCRCISKFSSECSWLRDLGRLCMKCWCKP